MKEIVEEMQQYYEHRAPDYDASMGYGAGEPLHSLTPVVEELKCLFSGKEVLEIACGPGFWTNLISESANHITATDYNETTLAQARQKPMDWNRVSLARVDAYNFSKLEGEFDGAFAVDWLAHVPRLRIHEFLQGVHNKLNDAGIIAFCDQMPRDDSISEIYDQEGNHIQIRKLPDGSNYQVIKHYFSDNEIHDIFSRYTNQLTISRHLGCKRIIVSYRLTS